MPHFLLKQLRADLEVYPFCFRIPPICGLCERYEYDSVDENKTELKMRYGYFAIVLTFSILINLVRVNTTFACSGHSATLQESIEASPIIIRAQVLETDDRNENSIVQVDTYFKGFGPEYMLISGNTRGVTNGLDEWRYGMGDCAGRYPQMQSGETVYMFLRDGFPGTYRHFGRIFGSYHFRFPTPNATESVLLDSESIDDVEITEDEFLNFIGEFVTDEPQRPQESMYPIPSMLRITTTTGDEYVLPPNGSPPSELTPELYLMLHNEHLDLTTAARMYEACNGDLDCFQFTPNYVDMAVQVENKILIDYQDEIEGQSFLFSSTSDTIAVWNNDTLELHILPYRHLFEFHWTEPYKIINTVELEMADIASAEHAAWSPDGRLLAYSDADGLWLWDVFNAESEPQLLLATESDVIPLVRHFSPLGRYLAIQSGDKYEYVDLVSLERLPDGMFSPDERFLIAYGTTSELSVVSYCRRNIPFSCAEIDVLAREVIWIDSRSYVAHWCNAAEGYSDVCRLVYEFTDYARGLYGEDSDTIIDIAYQSDSGLLAIARDGYSIEIDDWQIFDLSESLSSPIAKIEWLPSLFYFDN
jgi:hypothetical protein